MPTNEDGGLQVTDADGDAQPDHPPSWTIEVVVPVGVPSEIEQEARERADELNIAVEDAVADHVRVVPAWCISPAEDGPDGRARRVALHTAVRPSVVNRVDDLGADDRGEWVHEAVREKVARETDWPGTAVPNGGP